MIPFPIFRDQQEEDQYWRDRFARVRDRISASLPYALAMISQTSMNPSVDQWNMRALRIDRRRAGPVLTSCMTDQETARWTTRAPTRTPTNCFQMTVPKPPRHFHLWLCRLGWERNATCAADLRFCFVQWALQYLPSTIMLVAVGLGA